MIRMKKLVNQLAKTGLKLLCFIAPPLAGKYAARAFATTRNAANPQRQAFIPIGATAVAVKKPRSKIKNIYIWGETGEIVLLVHGWGADCGSMFSFIRPMLKLGYRVATFDGPAHGASEGNRATMTEYVADTQFIIEQLGDVSKVIAHSLGGIVAMAALKHFPKIKQLTLISAPCTLLDVLDIWSQSYMKLTPKVKRHVLKQLLKDNGVPVSYWDISVHGKEWRGEALVLHDKQDPIVDHYHAQLIAAVLPCSRKKLFSSFGHFQILSEKSVHHAIEDFFQTANHATRRATDATITEKVEHEL